MLSSPGFSFHVRGKITFDPSNSTKRDIVVVVMDFSQLLISPHGDNVVKCVSCGSVLSEEKFTGLDLNSKVLNHTKKCGGNAYSNNVGRLEVMQILTLLKMYFSLQSLIENREHRPNINVYLCLYGHTT